MKHILTFLIVSLLLAASRLHAAPPNVVHSLSDDVTVPMVIKKAGCTTSLFGKLGIGMPDTDGYALYFLGSSLQLPCLSPINELLLKP